VVRGWMSLVMSIMVASVLEVFYRTFGFVPYFAKSRFARMPTSQNRDMGHPIPWVQFLDVGHP
jgi:hypothetical protein